MLVLAALSPAAAAAGTASISGHLQNSNGDPVQCTAYALTTTGNQVTGWSVQPNGDYTLPDLDAGTYVVKFDHCEPYIDRFWNGKGDLASADHITVADGEQRTGVDMTLDLGGTISGRVTNAEGDGIPGVCVQARGQPVAFKGVTTDANGDFTLRGLPTTDYIIAYNLCGTLVAEPHYVGEYFDDVQSSTNATPVHVTAGQAVTGKNALLVRTASISGHITDDQGQDLANICVSASSSSGGSGSATTDAGGDYEVTGLSPGSYVLAFNACNSNDPYVVGENYNDKPLFVAASSDLVPVAAGQAVTGKDASLTVGGAVSGHVTDQSNNPLRVCVGAAPVGGGAGPSTATNANGDYTLTRLPPGATTVRFYSCGNGAGVFDSGATTTISRAATNTINASLELTSSISGHLTSSSGGAIPGLCVSAKSSATGSYITNTNASGDYAIPSLHAGNYKLSFADCSYFNGGLQPPPYTLEWWNDKPSEAAADSVAVAQGQNVTAINAELQAIPASNDPVEAPVIAGGTVSTDLARTGPTPSVPVTADVTSPNGGTVSIAPAAAGGGSPSGYSFFGQQVDITAPPASVDSPLKLTFVIDASLMPSAVDPSTVVPFRDGAPAGECAGSSRAEPDPCVSNRQLGASGDLTLTILTSHASRWNFGQKLGSGDVCTVPKLKGLKLKDAKKKLAKSNCKLGKAKKKKASRKSKGKILSQSAKPGSELAVGTKVNVVVGK